MQNPKFLALTVTDGQSGGHGYIDLACNPDQEDIYILYGVANASFYLLHTFLRH